MTVGFGYTQHATPTLMKAVIFKICWTHSPSGLRHLVIGENEKGPELPLLLVKTHSLAIFNAAGTNETARILTSKGKCVLMYIFEHILQCLSADCDLQHHLISFLIPQLDHQTKSHYNETPLNCST